MRTLNELCMHVYWAVKGKLSLHECINLYAGREGISRMAWCWVATLCILLLLCRLGQSCVFLFICGEIIHMYILDE